MVYINGRFLSQRLTGIQRFAYEICCALQQIGVEYTILAPADIRGDYDLKDLSVEVIGGKGSHYWEQVSLPLYMHRHHNGQLLVSLSGLSPLLYSNNILTIHDVSYLLRPRSYSWAYCLYYQIMTPLVAKRAKKIMTVSAFSKRELVDRYKFLGLFILVAIPLPGTGAWTGSLVSAVFGIDLKHAMPAIALGVLTAGIVVSLISYGVSIFL